MTRVNWQIVSSAAVLVTATLTAAPAAAQSRTRFEISANVGASMGAKKFHESETFPSNGGETATIDAEHNLKAAVGFGAGGAVKVASRLWVGAQYAMANMKPSASITAVVPHPLLFNAPRTVHGTMSGVAQNEQNVHVDVLYALPLHAMDVKVMAGPSFFNLKQDFVTRVDLNEVYPFDTATFASGTTTRLSKSGVGFNAGVDVSHPLSRRVGVGALIRYSRGNVKFSGATVNGATVNAQTVTAGGLEAGAGVRIRF